MVIHQVFFHTQYDDPAAAIGEFFNVWLLFVLFFVSELLEGIVSVTESQDVKTCLSSHLINKCCQMCSAAAWLLSTLFMLSSGSLFGVFRVINK